MRLVTISSSSAGNSYALVSAGGQILLLEAGIKMADVKKAIDYRIKDVVGCLVTHEHGDHAKYAVEYARFGVEVYGPEVLAVKKSFPYGRFTPLVAEKTYHIGGFDVVAFNNYHDVPIFGYMIRHADMGTLLFATDTYKVGLYVTGIEHYLIEANYSDALLKQNVWDSKINKAQADRIMLSHMSLDYTVKYLSDCDAKNSKTVTLCHLSERNSEPALFKSAVESALGVPCYIATKKTVVEL